MTDQPSSTGLDRNIAAALAYLAGPVSGLLIMVLERSSRFVRFHAMQSIVGLGGLWLLAGAFGLLAGLAVFVSATGFFVLLYAAWLTGGAWIVVWIICLVKAFTGQWWKLPVAGEYAERWSVFPTNPPSSSAR